MCRIVTFLKQALNYSRFTEEGCGAEETRIWAGHDRVDFRSPPFLPNSRQVLTSIISEPSLEIGTRIVANRIRDLSDFHISKCRRVGCILHSMNKIRIQKSLGTIILHNRPLLYERYIVVVLCLRLISIQYPRLEQCYSAWRKRKQRGMTTRQKPMIRQPR